LRFHEHCCECACADIADKQRRNGAHTPLIVIWLIKNPHSKTRARVVCVLEMAKQMSDDEQIQNGFFLVNNFMGVFLCVFYSTLTYFILYHIYYEATEDVNKLQSGRRAFPKNVKYLSSS
jgi:hypothetical protein